MSFYLNIVLLSVLAPLILSFDKKVGFYKHWKTLLPSIFMVAVVFIAFDMLYTGLGVWGFNDDHLIRWNIFNLPVEEVLFFICIPYASLFLHFVLKSYFPNLYISKKVSDRLSLTFMVLLLVAVIVYYPKLYTLYASLAVVLALILGIIDKKNEMGRFFITFLVVLVPFVLVNGLLTGSFLGNEVVWYNDAENCGIRFLTIPAEDFGYAFAMLFFTLWIKGRLETPKKLANR